MTQFGAGIRDQLPGVLACLDPSGVFGVVDEAVARVHGTPAALDDAVITVEGGEFCKDIAHWSGLLDRFIKAELDRHSVIVAVGGGAVLDLAGFAAAAYLRGVRWVTLPTTLLAQVDAAHGGKTAIDHPAAKNLVGAFHAPSEVLVDPDYLGTLPERELRAGLAEVIKQAVIGRPELLERIGRDDPAQFLEPIAQVKLEIVARDPLEQGERRLLNLGHTLGHALEQASHYRLHHGEAVALGLRAAGILAERHCGFADRAPIEAALDRCGLPSRTALAERQVLDALRHDKKRRGGTQLWVLPVALGDVRVFDDVPDTLVSAALSEIRAVS